jgi:sarcosine oxidase subunit beta
MSDAYFRGGWSGLFTTTPDWHPILDAVPGIEGLYCAVGFSGHGFKLAPMIGVTMAELIVEGAAKSVDISPLRFSRFEEGDLMESSYRYRVLA